MADAPVLGAAETVALDPDVFGVAFNGPLVHEVVIAELAARRQGTASTKTRGQVRGGGAKPWRQKGTGRARAGSSRSPIWIGGGTVFGPSPRHYTVKVNRKAARAALRSALSMHADRGSISVLDAASFTAPSTKQAAGLLDASLRGRTVLAVSGEDDVAAGRSFRNIEKVLVIDADALGVADVIGAARLVLSRSALESISSRAARPVTRAAAAVAGQEA